jgi:hypothetical protein
VVYQRNLGIRRPHGSSYFAFPNWNSSHCRRYATVSPLLHHNSILIHGIDALKNSAAGYHQPYAQIKFPWKLRRWSQDLFAIAFIYNFTAILPKLAILVLYRRLFNTSNCSRAWPLPTHGCKLGRQHSQRKVSQ